MCVGEGCTYMCEGGWGMGSLRNGLCALFFLVSWSIFGKIQYQLSLQLPACKFFALLDQSSKAFFGNFKRSVTLRVRAEISVGWYL